MADTRFFATPAAVSLAEIATLTGAQLQASDPARLIHDVAPLSTATARDISFLDNVKYTDSFFATKAAACFVRPAFTTRAPAGMALLISDDPYGCYATLAAHLYPLNAHRAGVHASAIIHPSAMLGVDVQIDAGAVVDEQAQIGNNVSIGANAVIGSGVVIGESTTIGPLCSISHALIGKSCILHRGIQIGQDGFGFAPSKTGLKKVPQLGRVVIGDQVEIGSNTCIDRGAGPDTVIGNGSKIDNLVQIGHNVVIGNHCIIVAQVGISGSSVIEDGVMLGGQVGVSGHITIGKGARVAAQSGVLADIPPEATYGGYPAVPVKDWHRQTVTLSKLIRKNPSDEAS